MIYCDDTERGDILNGLKGQEVDAKLCWAAEGGVFAQRAQRSDRWWAVRDSSMQLRIFDRLIFYKLQVMWPKATGVPVWRQHSCSAQCCIKRQYGTAEQH